MKKNIIFTAIAASILISVSCQKESGSGDNGSPADGRITVTATIESAATKVTFTEGAGEIKGSWEADDHIIGWDEKGRAIELAVENIREDGAAEFATVSGSAPLPASGKVYMIYAPGKSLSDVSDKSLSYDLTTQNGDKVPALMTATGIVAGNRLELRFDNELALVAVKNPKFPVTAETTVRGLKISGDNINTVATFSMNGEDLEMASSTPGALIRNCEFTTSATGASEVMTYFAVLPDSTPADITVSTVDPEGYQNSYTDQSFVKGQCYIMDSQTIDKQKFSIIIADGIENGTVTTDPENECGWGETVTVNAEPATDYIVDEITVTANNADIPVTGNTFTMPSEDVTVTVTFKVPVSGVSLNKASTSLTVGESETLTATVTPANATNPAITWSSSDETVATVTANGEVKGISVGNATITAESVDNTTKFGSCNVKITEAGVFTVSQYKKVRFTKGNLYWNGSSYQFENNQYDYRHYNGKTGDAAVINGVATTTPSGTVGSFWWISSVEAVGKPYDETYTQTMPTSGTVYFFTEESNGIAAQSKANQNFAVNGERGKYHVLNASEWNYLLHLNNYSNGRPLDSNLFAKARVHNVNGLLIFPDDYILPSDYTKDGGGTGMAVINNKTAMFPGDSIPPDVWSSMESEGVVFLPAAGYRTSDQIGSVGDLGHYLTSFANKDGTTSKLFFSASQVNCSGTSSCASGNLIRLIYEETGN